MSTTSWVQVLLKTDTGYTSEGYISKGWIDIPKGFSAIKLPRVNLAALRKLKGGKVKNEEFLTSYFEVQRFGERLYIIANTIEEVESLLRSKI